MNENTGNSGNDFFYSLLDNPADLSPSNAVNLQQLIDDFPQSGLLRSMLAVKPHPQSLQSASAYVNPKVLYKIANAFGSLHTVADEQIAFCEKPQHDLLLPPVPQAAQIPNLLIEESNYFHVPIDHELILPTAEEDTSATVLEADAESSSEVFSPPADDEALIITEDDTQANTELASLTRDDNEPVEEDDVIKEVTYASLPTEEETNGETINEDVEAEDVAVEISENESPEKAEDNATAQELPNEEDLADDETALPHSEEVESAENDDDAEQGNTATAEELIQADETTGETVFNPAEEEETAQQSQLVLEAEGDKIGSKPTSTHQEIDDEVFEEIVSIEDISLEQLAILDKTIVTGDEEPELAINEQVTAPVPAADSYFVFEPTLPQDDTSAAPAGIAAQNEGGQHVSRYNDEKMPYSFLWWLDKTRKEHAAIYRPYAVEGKFHSDVVAQPAAKPQPAADHLQQQYVENIFAVSAAVSDINTAPPKTDAPAVETKIDKIIEKFIHEEPQIKHPSKVKLDNENKAKKSSEDRDELVTETLAKIYTEQMLYHKAILTYKKLMLKFPEKSLYFAGQIEQLENKIN